MTPAELALLQAKANAFDGIAEILFPRGDRDHAWENDTIEQVAVLVTDFLDTLHSERN